MAADAGDQPSNPSRDPSDGVTTSSTLEKRTVHGEAALRASDERFRLASQALAAFLYDWNPVTNQLQWFGGVEEILGFKVDEIEADAGWYQSRVHPDDLSRAWDGVWTAFETGAPGYSNVYRVQHRDGHYMTVADRSHIVRDDDGNPIRVLGGVSDISERIRLEGERARLLQRERQARNAAEAASRSRDALLSIVSHDLGNPLSTIRVCAGALLDPDAPFVPAVREVAGIIDRAVTLMQSILDNLLDRARLDAGQLSLDLKPANVSEIISVMKALFAPVAMASSVHFSAECEAALPDIMVDHQRLQQILSNLLGNAMKFTPAGGRVVLSARLGDQETGEPPPVRFAVSDTGPGISGEDLPHIFDWFWQAPEGRSRGTGLGLAIAKGLVEVHGGHLSVSTALGHGTTFSFSLPANLS